MDLKGFAWSAKGAQEKSQSSQTLELSKEGRTKAWAARIRASSISPPGRDVHNPQAFGVQLGSKPVPAPLNTRPVFLPPHLSLA